MKKIVVWSSKGGVGKTRISVAIARLLALTGNKTGIVDLDINNPNLLDTLNIEQKKIELHITEDKILPLYSENDDFYYFSMQCFPEEDRATIFEGMKNKDIARQLLTVVDWSNVEWLVIDAPPSTSDIIIELLNMLSKKDSIILVTTPMKEAIKDLKRSIDMIHIYKKRIACMIVNLAYVKHITDSRNIMKKYIKNSYTSEQLKKMFIEIPIVSEVPLLMRYDKKDVEDYIDIDAIIKLCKPRLL